MNTPTLTLPAAQGQSTQRRYRPCRIARPTATSKLPAPTADQLAAAFRIRCERAICMIARSGVNTRRACRDVGLIGSEAERVVRKLCDDRNIPRKRYFGGPYRLLTSPGYYSATIERERERRQVREETARRVGRWRSANAERQYELTAVAAAIIRGDIDRGTRCEKCGSSRYICAGPIKLQPLRVTWWCRRCSNKVRRMKGRAPS